MLERFLFPANAGALERADRGMAEFRLALAGCPMPTIGAGLRGGRYSLRPAGVRDAANREGSGGGRTSRAEVIVQETGLRNRAHGVDKRQSDASHAEHTDPDFREPLAEKKHQRRSRQRKQGNQPQVIEKVACGIHASFVPLLI